MLKWNLRVGRKVIRKMQGSQFCHVNKARVLFLFTYVQNTSKSLYQGELSILLFSSIN